MSKKFSVSSAPKAATPAYDSGDPSVKAKGFQLTETSKGVDLHEPDRHYSFSKVSTGAARSFLHPPDRLIVGRVIFKAKYLGYLMVKEPKGVPVVKAAVEKIKIASDVQKTNNKDYTDPEVELCISIRALNTVDRKTKDTIVQHSLPLVSFSADVRHGKHETFAYIAKTSAKAKEYVCYAYEVPKGQGKQISATVSQAFELAYRRYQETKEIQQQFMDLKKKLDKASPEEKAKIKKEIAALEAKSIAEEERLQRAREQIRSEAEERGRVAPPTKKAAAPNPPAIKEKVVAAVVQEPEQEATPPPKPEPSEQPTAVPTTTNTTTESTGQQEDDEGSNGSEQGEAEAPVAEVEAAPAPPPLWKQGFDTALSTLEQQIKDLEEAFEWRKEMERKQRSLLGKDVSDQYLAGLENQMAKMPGNM